jgi:uncharacterized protein YcbX
VPTLAHIAVHPIKALDPVSLDRAAITGVGGLAGDRVYAIVDADGNYVNGKRTDAVHRLRASVDLDANRVALGARGEEPREFHLDDDRAALEGWLSDYFGIEVELVPGEGGEQTDSAVYGDGTKTGPTLISRATLREAASWYNGIDAEELRLRMRPNLVVEGVPAFWEDRLAGPEPRRLRIGDVTLEGLDPVPRCVVPTRDPHTGETTEGFQETFLERREATFPAWADRAAFEDTLFKLMTILRVPRDERGGELTVGDEVAVLDATAEP